ncbi:hypothetical protein KM043_005247 [Ampulex compressa]|nr:hypothetical protein KM043_005247 [Ampulex compressa]
MVNSTANTLSLVLAAIKSLRERKGSTSREILHYISSVCNIPAKTARRQMQTALKRGVAYGILRKNGAHYILPTDTEAEFEEVAAQELGLLDLRHQKKARQSRGCRGMRRKRRSSRSACKCKRRSSRMRKQRRGMACARRRPRRRKRECKCGGLRGRKSPRRREKADGAELDRAALSPKDVHFDRDEAEACGQRASGSNVSSNEERSRDDYREERLESLDIRE